MPKPPAEERATFNESGTTVFVRLRAVAYSFSAKAAKAMRIVLDVRTIDDHFPGIGRYAFQLTRALAREKDRGELVLLSNAGPANTRFDLAALASEPDVRIIPTPVRPFTAMEQLRLPYALRKLRPTATHFPYMVLPYAAPRPVVLTIHDIIPLRLPHFFTFQQRLLYRISLSLALRAATAVICVSEATRSDLISIYCLEATRIAVIREGVGEGFRPRGREETDPMRKARELPERYILYAGSNKPHKNLPVLMQAYARLRTAPPLVVAGSLDPRFDAELREVERLGLGGRIRFLGAVNEDELPALYSGAEAFVFPSLYEGFGLPPLEAMACGVPVACSDIPSLREIAVNAALFFDPRDCESLASALESILTDKPLRDDLRIRGLQRSSELTWDSTAKETLEVYRSVALRG
jgi:glycosyltransferase involved in cell wall biosynthesis